MSPTPHSQKMLDNAQSLRSTATFSLPQRPLGLEQALPSTTITTSSGIRIHAVQTGFVAVKQTHRASSTGGAVGLMRIALDPRWTEWLPINTWVIEHPEGVIVVDTGETARTREDGYFNCDPVTNLIFKTQLRFAVIPEEEIGIQLQNMGIPPTEVRWVVQTHLHSDHMGGMGYFPQSEFFVPRADYPVSNGALPCRYPSWLNPSFATFTPQGITGFEKAFALTRTGDVLIVPTPGHSEGHQSLLLRDGDTHYLFAGDPSFSEKQLLKGGLSGIHSHPIDAKTTLRHIQTYVKAHPTVYLPTHDAQSVQRLANHQIVPMA